MNFFYHFSVSFLKGPIYTHFIHLLIFHSGLQLKLPRWINYPPELINLHRTPHLPLLFAASHESCQQQCFVVLVIYLDGDKRWLQGELRKRNKALAVLIFTSGNVKTFNKRIKNRQGPSTSVPQLRLCILICYSPGKNLKIAF